MKMMLRVVLVGASIAIAGAAFAQTALRPALKRSVVVQGELVRIGDLIENAGAAADVAVFRAPDLGATGAVATAKILDAIRPYQLFAIETAGISEVEVTRAARVITAKEIEARVARAFAGQYGLGDAKKLSVNFERDIRPIYIDASVTGDLDIARAWFDPRSGRFEVTLEVAGSALTQNPLRVTGTLFEAVDTPVLTRSLQRGELIRAADVAIERRPKSEIQPDTIIGAEQAIGLMARSALRSGQVLRRPDMMKAEVIAKNDPVTLVYEVPGITLTTRGRAVDSGAVGDVISVLNAQSKRTVQGTVAGPGRVVIAALTVAGKTIVQATADPSE